MSKILVEMVLEVHDELARDRKEVKWLLENTPYSCMKFSHINHFSIYFE